MSRADIIAKLERDPARVNTEPNRLLLAAMKKHAESDRLFAAYRHSSYGSRPWSILRLDTGEDVPGMPSEFEATDPHTGEVKRYPISGAMCWQRKKDAEAEIAAYEKLLSMPVIELRAELKRLHLTWGPRFLSDRKKIRRKSRSAKKSV